MDRYFRQTELDATTLPAWSEHILGFDPGEGPTEPRSYPGYPRVPLPLPRARLLSPLDRALKGRRCERELLTSMPRRVDLGRLLRFAHGGIGADGRGPVPSAGGLQALELYLVRTDELGAAWLAPGAYHYDRAGHHLSQLCAAAPGSEWRSRLPSLNQVRGGALYLVLVGDGARVRAKYAERGLRFLLLEAGHLMQNLCLLSQSLGLCTVPLGGFLERDIAGALLLPSDDEVLYAAACGQPVRPSPGGAMQPR